MGSSTSKVKIYRYERHNDGVLPSMTFTTFEAEPNTHSRDIMQRVTKTANYGVYKDTSSPIKGKPHSSQCASTLALHRMHGNYRAQEGRGKGLTTMVNLKDYGYCS